MWYLATQKGCFLDGLWWHLTEYAKLKEPIEMDKYFAQRLTEW